MKQLKLFIVIISLLSLASCKKEAEIQPKDYPYVITNAPHVNSEGVKLSADLTKSGNLKILKYGFVWSEESNPTILDSKILFDGEPEKSIYSYNLNSGIDVGKIYFVRGFILTDKYEVYGNLKSFNSQGGLPPKILSFSPAKGYVNTKIMITGANFGNNINDIYVKFGDVAATIDSISDTIIHVTCPILRKDSMVNISIELGGKVTISEEKYKVLSRWKRMADYPGLGNHSASYFSINGKGFMIGGIDKVTEFELVTKNKIWEFDPSSNIWAQKSNLPFKAENAPTCVVNNSGYIYNENDNKFYKYYANMDLWRSVTSFPGKSRSLVCFAVNDKIYAGLGGNKEFFCYDVITKKWTELPSFPGRPRHHPLSFSVNGNGYIALGKKNAYEYYSEVWEYEVIFKRWVRKADFPGEKRSMAVSFASQSKAYIGMGTLKYNDKGFPDIHEFNPETNKWAKIDSYPGAAAWSNIAFTIDDKAYIGTGVKSSEGIINWAFLEFYSDLWELDLSKV